MTLIAWVEEMRHTSELVRMYSKVEWQVPVAVFGPCAMLLYSTVG